MSNTETVAAGKSPTHIAYHVRENGNQSYWTRIGAAWEHKDGKGFSLQIETIPLDGKIALRIATEKKAGDE